MNVFKNKMILRGFGFSGYRSFGDELVRIAPLKKINLIIGQNNVGKSNIIRFLTEQYAYFQHQASAKNNFYNKNESTFQDVDIHISATRANHRIAFPVFLSEIDSYLDQKPIKSNIVCRELAKKILFSDQFYKDEAIWFSYRSSNHRSLFSLEVNTQAISKILDKREWQILWQVLTGRNGGGLTEHWIPQSLEVLSYIPPSLPNVELISAIRKIGKPGTEAIDYSGEGIIERLAKVQNPSHTEQSLKEKFLEINRFTQEVLENESARIEIPYERDMILVHMDDRTLPLESQGTGIHEVVILAAASTLLENTVLCIEEPELHLHPLLQRKLVKYLFEKTNNQYFFTTHSAHLLDAVEAEIFHITQVDGISRVEAISSTKQKSNICNDLGYKASDILQANCIIWVEGPSDRLYLNYWLLSQNPSLVEGVHYSIMFYGGRLFSHLTALDPDEVNELIDDFISVRKLNRNTVIMFDSDKDKPRARLNTTKQRLKREFNLGPGFAWVTKGREVENYLNFEQLECSVKIVHPTAERIIEKSDWSNLLKYKKIRSAKEITANKVKVARHYIKHNEPDLDSLDLLDRIKQLIEFISKSNGNEI